MENLIQINNIVSQLPRVGNNKKRLFTNKIIIHWDGFDTKGLAGLQLAINVAKYTIRTKSHAPTIQYHYRISANGQIYQCLDSDDSVYHSGNDAISKTSLSVCVEGFGFTDNQKQSLDQLVEYLRKIYKKNLVVEPHRKYMKTSCPGDNIDNYIKKYLSNNLVNSNTMASYQNGDLIQVTVDNLFYRDSPKLTGKPLFPEKLKKNDIVTVLGKTINSDGYNWIDVDIRQTYKETHTPTGWIASEFTKLYKSSNSINAESCKYHLEQAKAHIDRALNLAK